MTQPHSQTQNSENECQMIPSDSPDDERISHANKKPFRFTYLARKVTRLIALLLLFSVVFLILLISSGIFSTKKAFPPQINHAFGIGMDLSPSYGTVAISYPNGSIRSIAKIDGDTAYEEMMGRLNLKSSQHLHEPYENYSEKWDDMPRKAYRDIRQRLGLPASNDVRTLSQMIKALRAEAAKFAGQPIPAAVISIPRLQALYGEDLYDAFEYLNLYYLDLNIQYRPKLAIHSTNTMYAGHGHGLCINYTIPSLCSKQNSLFPFKAMLAVSYTHTSLIASLVDARPARAYSIQEGAVIADLSLGYDASYANPDAYWENVRSTLTFPIQENRMYLPITTVLVSGDTSHALEFRQILAEVTGQLLPDEDLEVVDADPVYSSAKGAAEFAKRLVFEQKAPEEELEL